MSTIYNDDSNVSAQPVDADFYQKSTSVWPTALRWGAILGVVSIVFGLISYNLGMMEVNESGSIGNQWVNNIANTLLTVAAIVLGLMAYRSDNGGFLSLGGGVKWSLAMGLIAGIFTAVWSAILFGVIEPGIMDQVMEVQRQAMEDQGMPDDQIEMAMSYTSMFTSTPALAIFGLIGTVIWTLFIGFIASLVMKKP